MPRTRVAVELQVTQEYTGQQRHVCYLGPHVERGARFGPWRRRPDRRVRPLTRRRRPGRRCPTWATTRSGPGTRWPRRTSTPSAGWPGRPTSTRSAILDEWIDLTFPPPRPRSATAARHAARDDGRLLAHLRALHRAARRRLHGPPRPPLRPRRRRLRVHARGAPTTSPTATGSAWTAPGPPAPATPASTRRHGRTCTSRSSDCPDELLLFFHHVPYGHMLHSGVTVIQHIYDTHFAGVEEVAEMRRRWARARRPGRPGAARPGAERLDEQLRCAVEWRDQINTYFFRKSGVPRRPRPPHLLTVSDGSGRCVGLPSPPNRMAPATGGSRGELLTNLVDHRTTHQEQRQAHHRAEQRQHRL